MTSHFCKYHPSIKANWYCTSCHIHFCHQCIDAGSNDDAACPVCSEMMQAKGISSIPPLWHRIPQFFQYPLNFPPLLLILALVAVNFAVATHVLGFLAQIIILMIFTKYAYVIMNSIAAGKMKPDRIHWAMFSEDLEIPFKILFIIFYYGLFNTLVKNHADDMALNMSLLLSSFLFPASIMLLASSKRFLKSINPLAIADLIKTVGVSYIILFVFLGLLVMGLLTAYKLLFASMPVHLFSSVMLLVAMYFVLVMFGMMGYVLYQFHEQLGYENLSISGEDKKADKNGYTNSIDILLQEGRYAEAISELAEEIDLNPNDFSLRERLHRILCSIEDKKNLQIYSADYIVRLLLMGKPSEAIRVYMESLRFVPDLKIKGAKHRHELGRLLVGSGQSRAALSLLNDLHRDYPSYEGIPGAYLLVARIMFEYFNHEDKARKILEYLLQKYPDHPAREKVESYLSMLNNISSQQVQG